jgi:hypothetical protein
VKKMQSTVTAVRDRCVSLTYTARAAVGFIALKA